MSNDLIEQARYLASGQDGPRSITMSKCADALAARVAELEAVLELAEDKLFEINPSNYTHDDVCRLNDASVEVLLSVAALQPKAPAPADAASERPEAPT